jgi:hypothetical protein
MSFGTLLWALIAWEIFKTVYFKVESSIENYIWEQKNKKNPKKYSTDFTIFQEEREAKRKAEADEMLKKIMAEIKKEVTNQTNKKAAVKKAAPKRK